jgi:DNA repair exonuclease SbcCD ATPase subunit
VTCHVCGRDHTTEEEKLKAEVERLTAALAGTVAQVEEQRKRAERAEAELKRRPMAEHEFMLMAKRLNEARSDVERLREAGDYLVREVTALPWRPGEGHLTDAVEMWRSAALRREP